MGARGNISAGTNPFNRSSRGMTFTTARAPPRSTVRARAVVENVAAGYHTLAEAFSGWRDSPGHRANMLTPEATRIGIAAVYAPGSKYKVFWALILASPNERQNDQQNPGVWPFMVLPRT